jgi:hypothetical protein
MKIYTTKEMFEEFGEREASNKIHRFKCKPEKGIESELKNRIVTSDKGRNTTTHFILDENNGYKILAFFTLKFDRIEATLLGESVFDRESDDKFKSVYYIVYLARDDDAPKDNLRGNNLLDAAIEQIDESRNIVGGVNVVMIDAYTSKEKVCRIYEEYGFTKIPAIGDEVNTMTHFFLKLKI